MIDYTKTAGEWMKPLKRGPEIDLVEIDANWSVDDLPPMMFIKKAPNSHGFVDPRVIEQLWKDQFDWVYREMDYGVFANYHSPGCVRSSTGLADAGAADRVHQRP